MGNTAQPTKTKVAARQLPGHKRRSKGKQHPLHAESLEHMARELELNRSGAYPTAIEIAKVFRGEAKRIRSIVR